MARSNPQSIVDKFTGVLLTPSLEGAECLGNGEHSGIECCCDNCDYYLICFPIEKEKV